MRLSVAERALLESEAARRGLSAARLLREALDVVAAGRVARDVELDRAAVLDVAGQLRRIGVNLNQLARMANTIHDMPEGWEVLQRRVADVADRCDELVAGVCG